MQDEDKIEHKVSSVLEEEVQLMVLSAREKMEALLKDAREAGNDAWKESSPIKYKLQSPNEVLVRIRVEHSGFSTLNNQRFGAKFVGDVANPNDMLLFHRKKDPKMASKIKKGKLQPIAPEELEQTNLDDLIRQQLEVGGGNMQVFGQQELADAMGDFVDKSLTAAIADVAKDILKKKTKILISQGKANDDEVMIEKESQIQEILQRESQSQKDASMMEEEEEEDELSQQSKKSSKKRKAAASSKGKENSFELDDDDEDFGAPKSRSKKAAAKKTSDDLDDDDSDDEFEVPKPRAKKAPAPKSKTKAARRKKSSSDSEDVSDDDDDIEVVEKPASKPRSKPAARPKRSTSVKRTAKYAFDSDEEEDEDAIVDSDDDDEVLEVDEPKSKRKKAPTKSSSSSRAKSKTASSKKTTTSGTARSKKNSTNTSRRPQFDDSDDEEVQYVGSAADQFDDELGIGCDAQPVLRRGEGPSVRLLLDVSLHDGFAFLQYQT